jgi:DNA polymerase III subunit gamma/tau
MPQVMALKWRPQVFADMVGQEHITRTLQNAIKADRVAHAYIFAGPRGVGKTTTARIFAKALNCRNLKDTEPCNTCDICEEVNNGTSFDIVEIDAAAVNGIDDIRELQQRVGNAPATAKYKVYIFDEAHRISKPAFDAFLKTLEEPPEHVIFILASTEIHAFPATVQSRCQRFEFRSMSLETLLKQLRRIADAEQIEIDDKALYQIARSGKGSMRDAQRNLDQLVAFSGKKITIEDIRVVLGTIEGEVYLKLVEAAISQDAPSALTIVKSVIDGGKDLEHFYAGLLETFRHLAVAKAFPSSAASLIPLASDEVQKLVQYSSQMEEAQILSSLRLLIEQEWAVRHSANPQIILETLVLELCRLKQLTSVGDLLKQVESGAPVPRNLSIAGVPSAPVKTAAIPSKVTVSETPASFTPKPSPPPAGEPVLAVDEIEDPVEAEKNPEMAKLKSQWTEFLEKVGAQKKALQGVLFDTRPKHIDEGTLILVCKGPFHHEQLSKPENKVLVEKLLEEMLGRKINLVPVLPEGSVTATSDKPSTLRSPKPLSAPKIDVETLEKEEPIVAAALKMFGGKIVEVKRNNPQK